MHQEARKMYVRPWASRSCSTICWGKRKETTAAPFIPTYHENKPSLTNPIVSLEKQMQSTHRHHKR